MDLIDTTVEDPQHVCVRQVVAWPGKRYSPDGKPYVVKEPKGQRWRRVAVSAHLFRSLLAYVDRHQLTSEALIFDCERLRAEYAIRRERDPLPARARQGRYVSPRTGRSGEHGRYSTCDLGCRCPFCRTAYTEYRYRRAGPARGRRAAPQWREGAFVESRRDAVEYHWFTRNVWSRAGRNAGA